jgi:hypothetical protein
MNPSASLEEISENLASYAVDNERIAFALSRIPEEKSVNRVTVEYEIKILQILSVGWAISFFLENRPEKAALSQHFWDILHRFSEEISSVTSLSIGKEIDYFRILQDRMNHYLAALSDCSGSTDPTSVIGPAFARICGADADIHVIMAGSRIFSMALEGVRSYLDVAIPVSGTSLPPGRA